MSENRHPQFDPNYWIDIATNSVTGQYDGRFILTAVPTGLGIGNILKGVEANLGEGSVHVVAGDRRVAKIVENEGLPVSWASRTADRPVEVPEHVRLVAVTDVEQMDAAQLDNLRAGTPEGAKMMLDGCRLPSVDLETKRDQALWSLLRDEGPDESGPPRP